MTLEELTVVSVRILGSLPVLKYAFFDSYNEFLRNGNPDDAPLVNWAPPAGQ